MTPPPRTIDDYRRAYAEGLTVAEAMAALRRRVEALADPAVFIGGLLDDLDHRAAALDQIDDRRTLPLFGVPFAVKDNIDVAAVATTAACPDYAYQAAADAAAVALLVAAGAVPVAKTNLDQFATGLVGVRSPYGTARNVLDPTLVPGGSSSGSAVAVAAGLVPFALGTDTAGSGRVPAAANQIVGLKPTRGLVSNTGVVPACASFDCVSVFAHTVGDAALVFALIDQADDHDPWHRPDRAQLPLVRLDRLRLGVLPELEQARLEAGVARSYQQALAAFEARGATLEPIDLAPFTEAGALLYGAALVAERHAAVGPFVDAAPDSVHEVTRSIIAAAGRWSAADYHHALTRLRALRAEVAPLWRRIDALALPTVARIPSLAQVAADPVGENSALGRFATFTNLLDLAALTLPDLDPGARAPGRGLTLHGPAGTDRRLAALAAVVLGEAPGAASSAGPSIGPSIGLPIGLAAGFRAEDVLDVVVVGAHLEGQPLNHQLTERGGQLVTRHVTAPTYRFWALPDGRRPALQRVTGGGARIQVEVWALPAAALGSFAAGIAPPLGLGTVALDDGTSRLGFICETGGLDGALDITGHGGWRRWLEARPG